MRWRAWVAGALALGGLVAVAQDSGAEVVADEAPPVVDEAPWASAPLVAEAPSSAGAQREVMRVRAQGPVTPAVAEVAAAGSAEMERFPHPVPDDTAPEDFMRVEDGSSPDAGAAAPELPGASAGSSDGMP